MQYKIYIQCKNNDKCHILNAAAIDIGVNSNMNSSTAQFNSVQWYVFGTTNYNVGKM